MMALSLSWMDRGTVLSSGRISVQGTNKWGVPVAATGQRR